MSTRYLLDTNILIAALKGAPSVRQRLETTALNDLLLSTVVLGELEFGAEKSAWATRNRERLQALTERLPLLGVEASTARHYGQIRAVLERQGQPIGANDLWIAAQALAAGATLVTDNEREFARVPGLALENWLRDAVPE
ncbi:MAG: DUF4411 family protein [Proteobacteria bacterium]|nr:DUF4411 family protein [Pseudomonadota bacterium]MBS0493468.1 DUF4411 family protein [Pseudomonadota bacterium]